MVPPLRALNAQWAIIAPRVPIYKISTPVQQGLLIPIQEWAAVMTVYPALQVPFLQATELLSSHFSVLRSSYSQRVMLPYFFKPFESHHFQSQPLVLSASVKTRLRNVPQTFFLSRFLLWVSWTVWCIWAVCSWTLLSLWSCVPHTCGWRDGWKMSSRSLLSRRVLVPWALSRRLLQQQQQEH